MKFRKPRHSRIPEPDRIRNLPGIRRLFVRDVSDYDLRIGDTFFDGKGRLLLLTDLDETAFGTKQIIDAEVTGRLSRFIPLLVAASAISGLGAIWALWDLIQTIL